jgi:hypothetical protein
MSSFVDFSLGRSIGRGYAYYTGVACSSAGSSASDLLDVRQFAGGSVYLSTAGTATSLTLCGAGSTADYATAYYDANNAAVTLTISAGTWRQLPESFFGLPFCKFTVDTTTDISVFLKG